MSEAPPSGELASQDAPEPTPVSAVPDREEFVWTPAKRVSVLAALVYLEHGASDELQVHPHGLFNAERAGLVSLEPRNWHVTASGREQLRTHDLMDTYTVTPRPVATEQCGEPTSAVAAA
ncbi:MAG TPA: hypothetical protein VMD79_03350 [Solirubrobacteraceae bacterium]|nr:hypothetical protein [Solirubrobacteraceae bacterium]